MTLQDVTHPFLLIYSICSLHLKPGYKLFIVIYIYILLNTKFQSKFASSLWWFFRKIPATSALLHLKNKAPWSWRMWIMPQPSVGRSLLCPWIWTSSLGFSPGSEIAGTLEVSHNPESGKWLYLKGSYYWRDPFLTSMIMGGRVVGMRHLFGDSEPMISTWTHRRDAKKKDWEWNKWWLNWKYPPEKWISDFQLAGGHFFSTFHSHAFAFPESDRIALIICQPRALKN